MLKQIAWNTFKNTGNINTMMELMKVEKVMRGTEVINNPEINQKNIIKNNNEMTLK